MVLESFIIFLNALISLNTPADTNTQTETEQRHSESVRENDKQGQFDQADLWRGGWDYN